MNFLLISLLSVLLVNCGFKDDLPFELQMIVKEWDRLEDPPSKAKATCFSQCNDQPVDCFYTCSDSKEK